MKKVLMFLAIFLVAIYMASAQPTLPTINDYTVTEGDVLDIEVTLIDGPDNGSTEWWTDFESFAISEQNDTHANFSWNTNIGDAGTYVVMINASDNDSMDSKTFTITVEEISPPTYTMTLSEVNLGSDSQTRDELVSSTLTVHNTGTGNLTNIVLTVSGADTKYEINLTPSTIASLTAGSSTTVTVNGYVPLDKDSGNEKIGTITAIATGGENTYTKTADINMDAENELEIRHVYVTVDEDKHTLDDGEDVEVLPDSDITIDVNVKNTFSDDYDIEDITVTVLGSDDLDFIDDDDDISKIRHGKNDDSIFHYTIDTDADEDDYDVDITVIGIDENGAEHSDSWTIQLNLVKKGILIKNLDLKPDTLGCSDNSVGLSMNLWNVGDDEDEGAVEIIADSLDFERRDNFAIDQDEQISKYYTINIPNGTAAGTYPIEVTSFINFDEQIQRKYIYLTVPGGCSVPNNNQGNQNNNAGIVVTPPTTPPPNYQFVDSGQGETSGNLGLNFGVWETVLLILANVLVIVIIVILVLKFLVRI